MKKQTMTLLLTVLCVLAAGISYRCSRKAEGETDTSLVLESVSEPTSEECSEYETAADSGPETDTEPAVSFDRQEVCYVHICGEVNRPGVYRMEPGERIFQAVELAGGFTKDAAAEYLNLAMEVADGMKVVVPSIEEALEEESQGVYISGEREPGAGNAPGTGNAPGAAGNMPGAGSAPGIENAPGAADDSRGKVNINIASKEELMTLKGIGQARAEDIIRYRQDYGPFKSIEEIMNVSGIKEGAFQKIKEDITV